jgi:uncharacterized protein (TIGR03435 family)
VELVKVSLQEIVLTAFNVDFRRLSAPGWLANVRFDIRAAAPGATPAQIREMLKTLLIERFGLVTHTEPRPFDVHELVVGSGGHRMREVEAADELTKQFPGMSEMARDTTEEAIDGPIRNMVIGIGNRVVTGRSMHERTYADGKIFLNAVRMSMPELAHNLSILVPGSRVIDRTGLAGLYQFTIELPNEIPDMPRLPGRSPDALAQLGEPTGVSVFKAVEGLGLRLERRRAPLDVVVVDKIAREPTEN